MTALPKADTGALSADLEATIERCAGVVRSVASRHGLHGADVDEVFQEVRIRLWRSGADGGSIGTLATSYVYRTAAWAALDLIRCRHGRHEEGLDVSISSAKSTPETDLEGRETAELVERAVDSLLESRRPVVRMYLSGYGLDEIAELLGWTPDKTRNLFYRGMDDLRQELEQLGVRPGERPRTTTSRASSIGADRSGSEKKRTVPAFIR